jgi:NAD-dependent dihydropyrimidine dehydrogenase PreA subunit
MTYIIGKGCVDILDGSCVDVCPVDCIYSKPDDTQLFINPEECIDCAASYC